MPTPSRFTQVSVTERWIARCGGKEPMNDEEHLDKIYEDVMFRNSFAAESVEWALQAQRKRTIKEVQTKLTEATSYRGAMKLLQAMLDE